MKAVRTPLTTVEQERLFVEAADQALADRDEVRLKAELARNPELKAQFDRYMSAVSTLKHAPKEKAPAALATVIMRRVKRRRTHEYRSALIAQASSIVPAQVLIPVLLGVLVAMFLFFAAP